MYTHDLLTRREKFVIAAAVVCSSYSTVRGAMTACTCGEERRLLKQTQKRKGFSIFCVFRHVHVMAVHVITHNDFDI